MLNCSLSYSYLPKSALNGAFCVQLHPTQFPLLPAGNKKEKKRVEKHLPYEFPQSKAAIGSQLYMPKARCFTKHKRPAPKCFPCDTQRVPCKKEGKREQGRVRVSKKIHTHTHTQQNGHFSFLKQTAPKQWRKNYTGLHALQLH